MITGGNQVMTENKAHLIILRNASQTHLPQNRNEESFNGKLARNGEEEMSGVKENAKIKKAEEV